MKKIDISFTYLQYFYDAVLKKSIGAAARENFVSQSAISQGIAKLESALQVKLTTHQKQKFKLTEEGTIVFNEAKRLFSTVETIREKLLDLKGELSGELKFVLPNSLAQHFLPIPYLLMKERYPKVGIKFHRGSLSFIHEALRSETVDFALVLDASEFEAYDRHPIAHGHFRLYAKHPETTGILVDHLENYEVKELRERHKDRYGNDLSIRDAFSSWTLVLNFAQRGYGVGYLPEFMVPENTLHEIQLDLKPIQYSICIIKLKGSTLTRAEMAFLEILKGKMSIA
jgi:DNA-binding transcriptional LysR family regulator